MTTLPDLSGQVMLLTGGNAGIGREAAIRLAAAGATVALTSRSPDKGATAVAAVRDAVGPSADVHLVRLDLDDLDSVRAAAEETLERWDRLDVLICNAGGIHTTRAETRQGFERTFGANHLGHFALLRLLAPRLVASAPARVVATSSMGHHMARGISWADLQHTRGYDGSAVYCESKLANLMMAREAARRFAGSGVVANALHPGAVRSHFGGEGDTGGIVGLGLKLGRPFMVSPRRGSTPIVALAADPAWADRTGCYVTGGYVPGVRSTWTSGTGRDVEAARRLWEVSDDLLASVDFEVPPWPVAGGAAGGGADVEAG